jgi:hypothetical protein
MLEAGRARASGEIGAGQAWGGGVMRLGDILRDSVSQYAQIKEAEQVGKMRDLQMRTGEAELAAGQQQRTDVGVLGSAVASELDPQAIEQQLVQGGFSHLVPAFRKSWGDSETAKLTLKKTRADAEAAEADYFGALASGVKAFDYSPEAVKTAFAKAKADGYDDAEGLLQQLEQRPDAIKQLVDSLIQRSPTQRKLLGEEQDRALSQTREDRALSTAQQTQADQEADNRRAEAAAVALERDRERDNRRADATAARVSSNTGDPGPLETIIGPDGKAIRVPRREAVGKAPASGTLKPASGLEKRALNFFNRAKQADEDLEGIEAQIQQLNTAGQARLQYAPNFAQSDLGQSYTQAQRNFTEARLRKDSGAAIPPQEFVNDRQTYFAQFGDSQATLEQKRRARAAVLASLGFESGQALGEFIGDADEARALVESYKARSAKSDGKQKIGRFEVEVSP